MEVDGSQPMNAETCRAALLELEHGLHAAGGRVFSIRSTAEKQESWNTEITDWKARLSQWGNRCEVKNSRRTGGLKQARKQLLRAEFAYETALKRFAEIARKPLERFQADSTP